jgi:hypothetical protein
MVRGLPAYPSVISPVLSTINAVRDNLRGADDSCGPSDRGADDSSARSTCWT